MENRMRPNKITAKIKRQAGFLNVDLDIESRNPLDLLAEDMGSVVTGLHSGPIGMRASILLSLFVALTVVSCRHPNEFKNTPSGAPHALLRGTSYPSGGHAFATHINGQPTSFWRSSDVFRIPTGTNVVHTAYSDRQETLGYKPEAFVAIESDECLIARRREPAVVSPLTATPHPTTQNAWVIHDRRDRVIIRQTNASGSGRVVADAPKEDYVFGRSSANEAIAEYRKMNP